MSEPSHNVDERSQVARKVPVPGWVGIERLSGAVRRGTVALGHLQTMHVAGIVLTLATLIWGFVEYGQRVEANQAKETLRLVDLWDDPRRGLQLGNRRLSRIIDGIYAGASRDEIRELNEAKGAERAKLLATVGNRALSVGGNDARDLVEDQFLFFDRVATCVEAELCSQDVAEAFFRTEAGNLWSYFSEFVRTKRNNGYSGFGRSTQKFAGFG